MTQPTPAIANPVLILGAGVNGAALARELLLSGVPVVLADRFDLAFGATSKSSRLIHGGLRYLEYGDVKLVRESLAERTRLLRLAPHLVRPLRLAIPVRRRRGGFVAAAARFLGCGRRRGLRWLQFLTKSKGRGLWVVRFGLWLYDRFARDPRFARHGTRRIEQGTTPEVDPRRYRWLCEYTDGQMPFPERFVIELLEDARRIAARLGLRFDVHTYCDVSLTESGTATLHPAGETFEPSAVVNATGAWGDRTLRQLGVESPRLFGGTKGSHFITYHAGIREALGGRGVYAEADDGRLVFVLPYREGVLVGTTDECFDQSPEAAVATDGEIDYLLELVDELFPGVGLSRDDVALHYSGVRPLPFVPGGNAAAISRDHEVRLHSRSAGPPALTLVGGKLTTAREFAEEAARKVLAVLGIDVRENTRERPLPGGVDYPETSDALQSRIVQLAGRFALPVPSVEALWSLFGNRTDEVLQQSGESTGELLSGTDYPPAAVRWIIEHEWVSKLQDLVERRLLLVDRPQLRCETLRLLAELLVQCGKLDRNDVDAAVDGVVERLQRVYGKVLDASTTRDDGRATGRLPPQASSR